MIRLEDLEEAILECQGERNPDSKTCQKLAAFYIIKDHMYPDADASSSTMQSGGGNISIGNNYSGDAAGQRLRWNEFDDFWYQSDTEFAKLASKTDKDVLMQVVDELMTVLEATNPRLYNGVMKKILDRQD